MRAWRRTNGARRFVLGLAATGLFVVPLLNILARSLSSPGQSPRMGGLAIWPVEPTLVNYRLVLSHKVLFQ